MPKTVNMVLGAGIAFACVAPAIAQVAGWPPAQREVRTTCIGTNAVVVTLRGIWPDTCTPNGVVVFMTPGMIDVRVQHNYPPGTGCGDALTPWGDVVRIASLPPAGGWEVFASLWENGRRVAGPTILAGFVPIPPHCPADVTGGTLPCTPDGGVTIEDLLFFVEQFSAGALAADLDDGTGTATPDGGVTTEDLLFFLERYAAGC